MISEYGTENCVAHTVPSVVVFCHLLLKLDGILIYKKKSIVQHVIWIWEKMSLIWFALVLCGENFVTPNIQISKYGWCTMMYETVTFAAILKNLGGKKKVLNQDNKDINIWFLFHICVMWSCMQCKIAVPCYLKWMMFGMMSRCLNKRLTLAIWFHLL